MESTLKHYKLRIFYFNPQDSRIIVPKKNQWMGWTLNFANPCSYLILLSLVLFGSIFFSVLNKPSTISKTEKPGWKLYTNHIGKYAIQFPENFKIKEENNSENDYGFTQGWVCFYTGDFVENCGEGFRVLYSIPYLDGKGGGCEQQHQKQIEIMGKKQDLCIWETGFGNTLYLAHPKELIDVWPMAKFNGTGGGELTKTALEMLKTFSFTDK